MIAQQGSVWYSVLQGNIRYDYNSLTYAQTVYREIAAGKLFMITWPDTSAARRELLEEKGGEPFDSVSFDDGA